jgi:hypothetical protein
MINENPDTDRNGNPRLQTIQGVGSAKKDPDEWVAGDEPMTTTQASYLQTLSEEAGECFDGTLSAADAAKRIEQLREKTGHGQPKTILVDEQTDG